jgi:hypothetical protein
MTPEPKSGFAVFQTCARGARLLAISRGRDRALFLSIDRRVASDIRSGHQILVGLRGAAKIAVMARMSTKSREVVYGGGILGAKIRADGAREAAAMV